MTLVGTSATITVCSLEDMEQVVAQADASHLVSLINEHMMPDTPAMLGAGHHLMLSMNDIEMAVDGLVEPSIEHIERLVRFVGLWDRRRPLVIHCWAGISRSTAAAFITLCSLNPEVDEANIALLLRNHSATATPNNLLVSRADQVLQRDGRMSAAITTIGRGTIASAGKAFTMPSILEAMV